MGYCRSEDVRFEGNQPNGEGNVRLPRMEPQRRWRRGHCFRAECPSRIRSQGSCQVFHVGRYATHGFQANERLPYSRYYSRCRFYSTYPTCSIAIQAQVVYPKPHHHHSSWSTITTRIASLHTFTSTSSFLVKHLFSTIITSKR